MIPEVGSKQGEFYNCPNSRNSFQHIHGGGIQAETNSLPKNRDLRLQIIKSSQEKATQMELWEGTDDTLQFSMESVQ